MQKYKQREHIVYLHAKFQQLLDKDVYVHGDVYVPLWHRVIYRKDLVEDDSYTQEVFCVLIDDLPKHIKILENNDLLMYVSCVLSLGERIVIRVSEQKNVSVVVTETILENKYHIFLKEGIPKIQQGQVYDISELSNIIACFVWFSPPKQIRQPCIDHTRSFQILIVGGKRGVILAIFDAAQIIMTRLVYLW